MWRIDRRAGISLILPWIKAMALAALLLLTVHHFLFRLVTVGHTSMYPTLWPGDLLVIERWPKWSGFERGDVVVFRDPLEDHLPLGDRQLLVKRIVGVPGDTVRIVQGRLQVNGKRYEPAPMAYSHLVRMRSTGDAPSLLGELGLPHWLAPEGRIAWEAPLDSALAENLRLDPRVVSVEPLSLAQGARAHIFPFSPAHPWNGDQYGPVVVPGRGDTLRPHISELPLYDRLLSVYEAHRLELDRGDLMVDGTPLDAISLRQDFFFVLGDSRHYSSDSRHWGFLPEDQIVGRAGFVLVGKDPFRDVIRWGRAFIRL